MPAGDRTAFPFPALALAVLLAVAGYLSIPAFRGLAQQILRFFAPAQATAFPIPTASARETTPIATATPIAECELLDAMAIYLCQIRAVESIAGFDVLELPVLPQEFQFVMGSADPATSVVRQFFERAGALLTISQGRGVPAELFSTSDWSTVPDWAVEPIEVRGQEAEYARGMFVSHSQNGTEAVWESDAPVQRLRWQEGDFLIEIRLDGLPGDDEDVGETWLIGLAESLE